MPVRAPRCTFCQRAKRHLRIHRLPRLRFLPARAQRICSRGLDVILYTERQPTLVTPQIATRRQWTGHHSSLRAGDRSCARHIASVYCLSRTEAPSSAAQA